ncbi:MAG: copper amine oxidase N-terminal domain-containing protein [Armatimonadetes bacterium]|nr:copper amine oxidase N-terminal domain-containing protein [Armatimonadota bacterium]
MTESFSYKAEKHMKIIYLSIATLFALSATTFAEAQGNISVTVNGDAVAFTGQPPMSQNGRTLVPLRGVLEKIGATVRYSGPTKTIRATKGDTNISLTLGENEATVNSRQVKLDVPAQAVNGTTLVPLRFVAESLGADVRYDGASRVIAIRTDGKPNVIVPPKEVVTEPAKSDTETFSGIFVDFVSKPKDGDTEVELKMTDGRVLTLTRTAELLFQNQKIGFDDLRSGDKVVATVPAAGAKNLANKATISDDYT